MNIHHSVVVLIIKHLPVDLIMKVVDVMIVNLDVVLIYLPQQQDQIVKDAYVIHLNLDVVRMVSRSPAVLMDMVVIVNKQNSNVVLMESPLLKDQMVLVVHVQQVNMDVVLMVIPKQLEKTLLVALNLYRHHHKKLVDYNVSLVNAVISQLNSSSILNMAIVQDSGMVDVVVMIIALILKINVKLYVVHHQEKLFVIYPKYKDHVPDIIHITIMIRNVVHVLNLFMVAVLVMIIDLKQLKNARVLVLLIDHQVS